MEKPDSNLVQKLFHREEVLDTIQDEVVIFMTNLLAGNVPHQIIEEGRCQLRMADEYESISDGIASILKFHLKLRNQGYYFDKKLRDEIITLHDKVSEYLDLVSKGYERRQPEVITKARSIGTEVTLLVKELRDKHLAELSEQKIEPYVNLAYTSTLTVYRHIRDHSLNIAEAQAGQK